jgi:hypothetical protein
MPTHGDDDTDAFYAVANDVTSTAASCTREITRRELEEAVWGLHRHLTNVGHPDRSTHPLDSPLPNALTFLVARRVLLDPLRVPAAKPAVNPCLDVVDDSSEGQDSTEREDGDESEQNSVVDDTTAECVNLLDESKAG